MTATLDLAREYRTGFCGYSGAHGRCPIVIGAAVCSCSCHSPQPEPVEPLVAAGPVLLGRFAVESPEWHAARANGLGGSEIAAVLGLSPYQSMFSLYHRKKGLIGEQDVNDQMRWGQRLEPVVAAAFLEDHPEFTARIGGTYCHPERRWQIANPDLLLGPACDYCDADCEHETPTTLLEVKTAMFGDEWGPSGGEEIPARYRCQVLWYLDVMGLDTADLAVLIGGSDYREYTVRADAAETAFIRDAGADFIRRLVENDRPDIDAHDQTYQAIRQLHPEISGPDVDLDADVARAYCTARYALDAAKAEETRTKSLVADVLCDGKRAMYLGKALATRQAKATGTPFLVAGRNLPTFDQETTP